MHTVHGEHLPWKDAKEEDICAFFRFCMFVCINSLPPLRHYWSSDPYFHYQPVAGYISRNRFMDIWRFLHFLCVVKSGANNGVIWSTNNGAISSTDDDTTSSFTPDGLCKIRPVISGVLAVCRAHYWPNREQSIDEAMVAFKGRFTMKLNSQQVCEKRV